MNLYFMTTTSTATSLVGQGYSSSNGNSTVSTTVGTVSITASYAGGVTQAAAKAADKAAKSTSNSLIYRQASAEAATLGKLAKGLGIAGGALGLVQVGINGYDSYKEHGTLKEMSAGDLLNIAAAVALMFPGTQIVGVGLIGLSTAYSIYENKNGKLTIGEVGEYWHTKMDDLSKKLDGRDPSWGKGILEKLLKLSNSMNDAWGRVEDWIGNKVDDWKNWFGINRSSLFHIYDPLVLDLDGDGIELVNANGWNGIQFDFNGNGIKTATQWVKPDDGLLVWDRNNNGIIDDGSELFGEDTPTKYGTPVTDGFSALQTVDSHPDGEINAKDREWKNLKVWRDLNQDGETQKGELFTLDELGITALSLSAKNGTATFTYQDGKKNKLADVNLNRDTVHSEYKEHIAIGETQLKLPNLHGVGMLRDLREAATLSEKLTYLVQRYQAATTKQAQLALLPELMEEWAKTDPHFNGKGLIFEAVSTTVERTTGSTGVTPSRKPVEMVLQDPEVAKAYSNAIKRGPIVDSFLGTESKTVYYWDMKMATQAIKTINDTYDKISERLYNGLLMQTRLKGYADALNLTIDDKGNLALDYTAVAAAFKKAYAKDRQKAFVDLAEFLTIGEYSDWTDGVKLFCVNIPKPHAVRAFWVITTLC